MGDSASFGELVRRYQDRLFNSVFRVCDTAEDAADVVQEAFLHAYQALPSFKGDSQFFTWIYRIAFNTAITLKRKQKSALRLNAGELGTYDPADPSDAARPDHAMETSEDERRVQEALQRLSPEHRAVLVLKDMDEMKYEEMAEVLQVPIGTIRSRLHRARLELKEILEKDD
ncbi:MAG: sigma-70 family RNA polymerase sigma factor [Gemmataceae bacterium]|nr:sigma-70 family RNA polymerase sigma factor [Gemmataceae bacterium]